MGPAPGRGLAPGLALEWGLELCCYCECRRSPTLLTALAFALAWGCPGCVGAVSFGCAELQLSNAGHVAGGAVVSAVSCGRRAPCGRLGARAMLWLDRADGAPRRLPKANPAISPITFDRSARSPGRGRDVVDSDNSGSSA